MPELPEVHALAADLRQRMTGRTVGSLLVMSIAALKTFDPSPGDLAGSPVVDVQRHGKFLDLTLGDLHLVVHLAKMGWIRWSDQLPPLTRGARKTTAAARLAFEDGAGVTVTEWGPKKRLAIWIVHDPVEVPGIATLGPDPLDPSFTEERFGAILASSGRAQIKGVLRNQGVIAGIGNAYSDEILHVARMSPFKPAAMPDEDAARLYVALRETLADAVARSEGLAAAELKGEKKSGMRVHGRTGEACPVCGDVVRQVRFADSSLQYCATCQTGGKPLADRALSRLGIPLT
jgi:formamidopyrimidine-DNA glycosylase